MLSLTWSNAGSGESLQGHVYNEPHLFLYDLVDPLVQRTNLLKYDRDSETLNI